MPLTEEQRVGLHKLVDACRDALMEAVAERLQAVFGIHSDGRVEAEEALALPDDDTRDFRRQLVTHLAHIRCQFSQPESDAVKRQAVERLTRETAFTHLNRFCAYKMLTARKVIQDPIGKGGQSRGFIFFCADHPEINALRTAGRQESAYRQFLTWQAAQLAGEMEALFSADDPASGLYPTQRVLDTVFERLNAPGLHTIWQDDEAIGWVYQFFTTNDERKRLRKANATPQNSYEMAVRNQFFTPRYIVEFLGDNTLGRTWIEMRQGNTGLAEKCRSFLRHTDTVYFGKGSSQEDSGSAEFVRLLQSGDTTGFRPFGPSGDEMKRIVQFAHTVDGYQRHPIGGDHHPDIGQWLQEAERRLLDGEALDRYSTQDLLDLMFIMARRDRMTSMGSSTMDERLSPALGNEVRRRAIAAQQSDLSPAERDGLPRFVPYRAKKDPREIRALDPASGSGHFLLYAFELFLMIYAEAYDDPELGGALREEYPDRAEFDKAVPALILAHNLWGVDIDRRCAQIASLALTLRAHRAWNEMDLQVDERPEILKTNIVCAEPMPGEADLFEEFARTLDPPLLAGLVKAVFDKMQNADTLGSLLKIEDDLRDEIAAAKRQFEQQGKTAIQMSLGMEHARPVAVQQSLDVGSVTDASFFDEAEERVIEALRAYAQRAAAQEDKDTVGLSRRLFASDAEQGFAFVDLCRHKFDVVVMNPPFGDAAAPSKKYLEDTYGDTKGDVYKAFIECFQDRLVPGGYLGAITSRTGFFLGQSADWRARVLLRLYRPLIMADLGAGVLDAMVETAAYVLRSLTGTERQALTATLAARLGDVKTDKKSRFTRAAYAKEFDLKRHQAEQELDWLEADGYLVRLLGETSLKTGKPGPDRFMLTRKVQGSATSAFALPVGRLICLRLLAGRTNDAKCDALEQALVSPDDKCRFSLNPESFLMIPGQPFSYWVSNRVRKLFEEFPRFEREGRVAKVGLNTSDDFRFVRNWWEVCSTLVCPPSYHKPPYNVRTPYCILGPYRWFHLSRGGTTSPFYSDLNLVLNWQNDGMEIKDWVVNNSKDNTTSHWSRRIASHEYYFTSGLTWPLRSSKFAPSIRPAGSIFTVRGYTIVSPENQQDKLLGLGNSSIFDYLYKAALGRFGFPEFVVGVLQDLPVPFLEDSEAEQLGELARDCAQIKRNRDTTIETSHVFSQPTLLQVSGDTLATRLEAWTAHASEGEMILAANQCKIDDIAFRLYGIKGDDRRTIEESLKSTSSLSVEDTEKDSDNVDADPADEAEDAEDAEDADDADTGVADAKRQANALISYSVGCAFGRFDVRVGAGLRTPPPLPDPFAPLPVCSPGMLTGPDGLPTPPPADYPISLSTLGVLVDDSDERGEPRHEDDIVARVDSVLGVLFGDGADAARDELCRWLEVSSLREYFRKTGAGGFWQDHLRRYSKSRRKAPIYWLLQSKRRNYGLWLYAHALDADSLYKTLIHYAEPALKREEDAQNDLRQKIAGLPLADRSRRTAERDLDKQEALVGELTDFCEKLRRAAERRLVPDLNDGVVLTIAPLHELVPWPLAKDYWKALQQGKYPWSSIAEQLAAKGGQP